MYLSHIYIMNMYCVPGSILGRKKEPTILGSVAGNKTVFLCPWH